MTSRVLYCHCAYARIVPAATKVAVLRGLSSEAVEFDAVPDLCEMAARKDPRLRELAEGEGELRIAACYPRAVKWLLASAGINADRDDIVVLNMRTETPECVLDGVLGRRGPAAPGTSGGGS
jgi:hypothetical protein